MIECPQAGEIARAWIVSNAPGLTMVESETQENSFGWMFFYDSSVPDELIAGNAPIMVSRETGVVHITDTAHPVELHLSTFARFGKPYPLQGAIYRVTIRWFQRGGLKISLTALLRQRRSMSLAAAKRVTDDLLAGQQSQFSFSSLQDADAFHQELTAIGVTATVEIV